MTEDINVKIIDFTAPGKEMVVPNEDGSYTILINTRLSYEEQVHAYEHAMNHIRNCDFEKEDVQKIEAEAHGIVKKKYAENEHDYLYEKDL